MTAQEKKLSHENNLLTTLTQNLDPELAQQVKKFWFEPNDLCCQNMIGKGTKLHQRQCPQSLMNANVACLSSFFH